jgi:hypothetical protein
MNISNAEKERRRLKITDEIQELSNELNEIYIHEQTFSIISDKKKEVLKEYLAKRKEIKQYLPDINDLVLNNIIYVVFDIHANVKNPRQYMKIPESMILFKLMTSDYGTFSCPHIERREYIKELIYDYIQRRGTKYTKRNNIKYFKMLMNLMIEPLQDSIDLRRSELRKVTEKKGFTQKNLEKIGYGSVSVKNAKHFTNSDKLIHIHSFIDAPSKKIVKKEYYIDLHFPNTWNQINVIHPNYPRINLVDYVDATLLGSSWLKINMKDIFDLFKHVKYVFLVDFSCTNGGNAENISDLKKFYHNVEGNSITSNINDYIYMGPYNILNEYEQEAEDARLKKANEEKAEINFDKGYNNLMKSRNPFWRNSPAKNYNQMNKSNKSWLRRALRFTRKLYN